MPDHVFVHARHGRVPPTQPVGEVDPASDPDVAAARLAAVAEGPATQVHRAGSEAATRARAAVRAEVDALFSGECRQYTR